jgi:uncharacterized Fe-S cluster protein YjdI
MSEREIIKEYSNGDFTVVWKPKKCIHAAVCVKSLPEVYDPNAKPWIKPEAASIDALKSQIDKCPSGALTYYTKGEQKSAPMDTTDITKIEVIPNGPLMVHGTLSVTGTDGKQEAKKRATAFCRCGASENKPYCDGTHNAIEFKD